jgi:hypothetical protein
MRHAQERMNDYGEIARQTRPWQRSFGKQRRVCTRIPGASLKTPWGLQAFPRSSSPISSRTRRHCRPPSSETYSTPRVRPTPRRTRRAERRPLFGRSACMAAVLEAAV